MATSIFDLLKKRGIVVPENQIQPLMSQWDAYELLKHNPNFNKPIKRTPNLKRHG